MSPLQVLNIVWAIYRNLPSIRAVVALNSLDRALLVLTGKHPSKMVASLLQCSPMCTRYGAHQPLGFLSHWERGPKMLPRDFSPAILRAFPADRALGPRSVAGAMWKAMLSEPQAAEKVLRELLNTLMNQSLRKTSTSTKDNPRILSLAVSCWMRPRGPPGLLSAVRGPRSPSLPTPSLDLPRGMGTSWCLGVFCRQPGR